MNKVKGLISSRIIEDLYPQISSHIDTKPVVRAFNDLVRHGKLLSVNSPERADVSDLQDVTDKYNLTSAQMSALYLIIHPKKFPRNR